VRRDLYL
jgi:hypothetical protein